MGLGCVRGIVEKMGEGLVVSCIEIFEDLLSKNTDITKLVGLCRVIYNMASGANFRLLATISKRLILIMEPYLVNE